MPDEYTEFPSGDTGPSDGEMICARSKSAEAGVAVGYVDARRQRARANQPSFATGAGVRTGTQQGIHTGEHPEVDRAFLEDGLIAIGWPQIQDLSELPPSREGFKKRYREIYPDARDGAIPVQAGQLFRFVHEMEQGHLVIYPSKVDKQIHIGRVTGDYRYRLR